METLTGRVRIFQQHLLRGGPSFIMPGNQSFNLNIGSDHSKKLSFFVGNYHGSGDADSFTGHEYYGEIAYRPSNSIAISVEPGYGIQNTEMQYVSTTGTAENPAYIFASLDQTTLNFTLRVNYTINPELSIEYYGQPFVSGGEYTDYKKITDPLADHVQDRFHVFTSEEISYDSNNNSLQYR